MIAHIARRALASFTAWRSRRRMAKQAEAAARWETKRPKSIDERAAIVMPDQAARRAEIDRRRRRHRPTRHLIKAQFKATTSRLQSELSATLPDRRFS